MQINHLQLEHFRNYDVLDIELHHGLTIVAGENAQGKTNLLEAIFLLSMGRSHRMALDSELIQWGQENAHIKGLIKNRHYEFPLELYLNKKGKVVKVNHLEQSKLSQFIGKLNVILFAPDDLQLVKGSPNLRRRFLNTELGQAHPLYLKELQTYEKILKQRNTYLKDVAYSEDFDPLYFEIITGQLINSAVELVRFRRNFIKEINEICQSIHQDLSLQRDDLTIDYQSSSSKLDYDDQDYLTEQFIKLFDTAIDREKKQGTTVYGPHRDDIIFTLNNRDARNFASQGQQRSIVLSLKLAEIEWIYNLTGEYPVLLLDDVLSELDEQRQFILMKNIEAKVQTILTTASINKLKLNQLDNAEIIYVDQGTIYRDNKGDK